MASRKVQSQMQINVSFVGETTKLFKNLEQSLSKLNLSSTLTKQLETELTKGFKDTFANLNKMAGGLSKSGLNSRQYTSFFTDINNKIKESTKIFASLKKNIIDVYNSKENKEATKGLEEYKKQLIEIKKLSAQQKSAKTWQEKAITKLKDETGIDYNISKRSLSSIASRKAEKKDLTSGQQS